ncbi:hypothetical protein ACIGBH_27450 [Streptomyces sp. NPDC085929]|uniref:hypothetical protein n=1 Tax=Streptomyces sp. NPDC085929 TaxID=3365739 RepID=UPI0037D813CF
MDTGQIVSLYVASYWAFLALLPLAALATFSRRARRLLVWLLAGWFALYATSK